MALGNRKPAFETEDNTPTPGAAVADTPAVDTSAHSDAASDAGVQATTAIAKAATTAVAAAPKKFTAALTEYLNVMDPTDVQDLGAGAFPKVVANMGGFSLDRNGAKEKLGKEIDFELISYNERIAVVPGVDGADAKKKVRYSYDGKTIRDEDLSVEEYLASLKDAGFEKASIKKYLEVWGMVVRKMDAKGVWTDIPVDKQEIVQLQLSPQSVTRWKAFQVQFGMKISKGLVKFNGVLRVTQLDGERDGNEYGYMDFSLPA